MDLELIKKVDQLLDIFENSDEFKRITELKNKIYNDVEIKNKLEKFNSLKNNPYSTDYIALKKEILNIDFIKEYKELENNLLLLTFSINKKLKSLVNNKGCNYENN